MLGWIVRWEQLRIERLRATARAILTEDTNDPFATYHSQEEAIEASRRVIEDARLWAEGWPDPRHIVAGAILDA